MSEQQTTPAAPHVATSPEAPRHTRPLVQLTRLEVLAVWAAATVPMGAAAWLVAPWLAERPTWDGGLPSALVTTLAVGLVWQGALVAILVRREQGTWRWPVIAEALWLTAPTSPRSRRRGGRVWWVVLPLVVALVATQAVPALPHAAGRDLGAYLGTTAGQEFFAGAWGWFAVVVVLLVFNTVLGEELLFRGYLLPRMATAFGRGDWVANGVLFTLYHVHTPWTMPAVLLTTFVFPWSAKRYRSALVPITVHSVQTVALLALLVPLVAS